MKPCLRKRSPSCVASLSAVASSSMIASLLRTYPAMLRYIAAEFDVRTSVELMSTALGGLYGALGLGDGWARRLQRVPFATSSRYFWTFRAACPSAATVTRPFAFRMSTIGWKVAIAIGV